MKRKRGEKGGHKKLKIKQTNNNDTNNISSESEPEPVNITQPEPVKEIKPDKDPIAPIPKPQAVYSRVRVKIKSPIVAPISNPTSISDPNSNLDPNQGSSEKNAIVEKTEDSDAKTPKVINTFSRKFGGIKIKTNKNVTPGGTEIGTNTEVSVPVPVPVQVPVPVIEDNYNEDELNSALSVIKKIMKMEAAAPFNAPVDPIALGIPDYFDVIEKPMDFLTICSEIEKGPKCKYRNSEDVYKDVQLIWQNCYKYNNKGDYIIDLMRRVKKNFSKYWGAAGLTSHHESTQNEEGSNEKSQKGKSKQKKKKVKRSTMDHRSDCLCAVCVIRRRKLEKENDTPTINLEEKSPMKDPDTNSPQSMDNNNNNNNNNNSEEKSKKKEIISESNNSNIGKDKISPCTNNQASQQLSTDSDETTSDNENEQNNINNNNNNDDVNIVNDNNNGSSQLQENGNKIVAVKKNEILIENHVVLDLCKNVFDNGSIWTGSRSIIRQPVKARDNPFHSAIASLLKH